jgi:hypothetical protein
MEGARQAGGTTAHPQMRGKISKSTAQAGFPLESQMLGVTIPVARSQH